MNKYGSLIASLRKKQGITQKQLAEKLNISYQAVSKWENNLSEPDLITIENLAKIFNITVADFFDMANNPDKVYNATKSETVKVETLNNKSDFIFGDFVKSKPWYLIAGLSVIILLLSLIVVFVPIKYSSSKIYKMVDPSVFCITLETKDGKTAGSGFFINSKGLAVTNYHVIDGATSGKVQLNNGKTYNIKKVVGCDEDLDIAIIQIDIKKSKPVKLGNSNDVKVGETVYAIGYPDPFGLGSVDSTLTQGIVSKKSYTFEGSTYIQTTVDITGGNSGGVLVNRQGRVIGIITCALTDDTGSVNYMNMAVPINKVKDVKRNLKVTLSELVEMHKDHTVTFISDGIVFGRETVAYNQTVEPRTISKAGYQFAGWYIDENCTILFDFNQGIKVNTTLYAKWLANTYIVRFDNNGESGYIPDMVCEYGQTYLLPTVGFTTEEYRTLSRWQIGSTYYFPGSEIKNLTTTDNKVITCYAYWAYREYMVLYDTSNEFVEYSISTSNNTYTYVESFTLPTPTSKHYTFLGWTGESITTPQLSVTIPKGSMGGKIFISHWQPKTYTITYNLNGGEEGVGEFITSYTYETQTFDLPKPIKEYYNFDYWKSSSGKSLMEIEQFSYGDIYITAQWKDKAYRVGYEDKNEKTIKWDVVRTSQFPYKLGYYKPSGCYFFDYNLYADTSCTQMIMSGDEKGSYTIQTPCNFMAYVNGYYTINDFSIYSEGTKRYIGNYQGNDEEAYVPETSATLLYENAFKDNVYVKNIYLPNTITYIGKNAFNGCISLKSVQMLNVNTICENAFANCQNLTEITIPNKVITLTSTFSDCKNLQKVTLHDNIIELLGGVFANCTSLTNIDLPANLIDIDTARAGDKGVFEGCTNLTNISFPSELENIGRNAFNGCASLTTINIPGLVQNIGYKAFANCTSLETISLGSVVRISSYAFDGCIVLQDFTFPLTLQYLEDYAFLECCSLTEIELPEGLLQLGTHVFYDCKKLAKVNVPHTVTHVGYNPFLGTKYYNTEANWDGELFCVDNCLLATKYLHNTTKIKDNIRLIAEHALSNGVMTAIEINELINEIPLNVFFCCYNLETIIIGANIKVVEYVAFQSCSLLQSIYYIGTQEQFEAIEIEEGNEYFTSATVYYFASEKPESEGKYWHYDNSGNIVIW